ncbi:MAG: TIGR00730 family Rossman fold protein [Parabacteroides sp.]
MNICTYCASSTKIAAPYFEAASTLGRLLGEQRIGIINGAGNIGLMKSISDAALAVGGEVTGVIPSFMIERGWCHQGLTRLIEVPDMHTRKQRMAELADAAIALPGGCGTLEELLEVITWRQLGLYPKPIIILNTCHYYDPLIQMFRQAIEGHFMRPVHQTLWQVADTPEEALQLILSEIKIR